jgi:hypothetical protein
MMKTLRELLFLARDEIVGAVLLAGVRLLCWSRFAIRRQRAGAIASAWINAYVRMCGIEVTHRRG